MYKAGFGLSNIFREKSGLDGHFCDFVSNFLTLSCLRGVFLTEAEPRSTGQDRDRGGTGLVEQDREQGLDFVDGVSAFQGGCQMGVHCFFDAVAANSRLMIRV